MCYLCCSTYENILYVKKAIKLASLERTEEHVRVPTCSRAAAAESLWNVYIQGKQITRPRLISRNPRTREEEEEEEVEVQSTLITLSHPYPS